MTVLTVYHTDTTKIKDTNQTVREALGRGHVIEVIQQKKTISYQSLLNVPNPANPSQMLEVQGAITEEQLTPMFLVAWENIRHKGPTLHSPSDLEWEYTKEQYEVELQNAVEPRHVIFRDHTTGNIEISHEQFTDEEDFEENFNQEGFEDVSFVGMTDKDFDYESVEMSEDSVQDETIQTSARETSSKENIVPGPSVDQ